MYRFITQHSFLSSLLLVDIVSFFVYPYPLLNSIAFLLIFVCFFVVTYKDESLAFAYLIAELVVGSLGYIFAWEIFGPRVSLRLGLFLIVILFWFIRHFDIQALVKNIQSSWLYRFMALYVLVIAYGVVRGIAMGNSFSLIFSDMNGYLYIALLPISLDIIQTPDKAQRLMQSIRLALMYISIKVLIFLYIFSHPMIESVERYVYRWVRDTGLGEITRVSLESTFHRIFLQSQIITLYITGLLVILMFVVYKRQSLYAIYKEYTRYVWLFVLMLSSIIVSFSRSFWVGLIIVAFGFVVYGVVLVIRKVQSWRSFFGVLFLNSVGVCISITLLLSIANFPFPQPGMFGFGDITERAKSSFQDEAAVSSRWNLLGPLKEEIIQQPFWGTGFGTTITYESNDPRIKNESNPSGAYTTSTFEWGYLDTVTEVGVFGLLAQLLLYGYILLITGMYMMRSKDATRYVYAGSALGLSSLYAVHFFSPYLNHPLGLGVLIIHLIIIRYPEQTIKAFMQS